MTMKNFVQIVIYSTCLIMSVGSLSIDENVGSDAINICSVLSTESAAALFSLRGVAASTPAAVCVCVCVSGCEYFHPACPQPAMEAVTEYR